MLPVRDVNGIVRAEPLEIYTGTGGRTAGVTEHNVAREQFYRGRRERELVPLGLFLIDLSSYGVLWWIAFAALAFIAARVGRWYGVLACQVLLALLILCLDVAARQKQMSAPGWDPNGPDMDAVFSVGVVLRVVLVNSILLPVSLAGVWLSHRAGGDRRRAGSGDIMGIFKRLLEHRRFAKQRASLLEAASRGDTPAVLAMLDDGLEVDAEDHGVTALFMAATDRAYETVAALLGRGADANAKEEEHSVTALMQAVASGDVRIVRALLDAGAEVNAWDWMGQAALDYTDDEQIADLLRRAGAEHGPGSSP
jgi:hypothetical protein